MRTWTELCQISSVQHMYIHLTNDNELSTRGQTFAKLKIKCHSSGMWCCVLGQAVPDVQEEHNTLIFEVNQSNNVWIARKCQETCTQQQEGLYIQQHSCENLKSCKVKIVYLWKTLFLRIYFTAWNLTHHRWEKQTDNSNKAKGLSLHGHGNNMYLTDIISPEVK